MLRITMTSRGELPKVDVWGPKPCILLRCVAVPKKGDRAIIQVWTWQDPVYQLALTRRCVALS